MLGEMKPHRMGPGHWRVMHGDGSVSPTPFPTMDAAQAEIQKILSRGGEKTDRLPGEIRHGHSKGD